MFRKLTNSIYEFNTPISWRLSTKLAYVIFSHFFQLLDAHISLLETYFRKHEIKNVSSESTVSDT